MATPFALIFARLRRQAGFETAYQFYHKNGGRRAFGCSFQNYLRIENGANLPVPKRLPELCLHLRLPLRGADMRELLRAYLQTWAGSEDLAQWLIGPFERVERGGTTLDPAAQALSRVVRDSARPLTLEQYKAVMSSAEAYWCCRVLTNEIKGQTAEGLARILGFSPARIRKGLEALSRCGMARRRRDGGYESPYAGSFLTFPDTTLLPPRLKEAALRYTADMVRRKGAVVDMRHCGVRADAVAVQGFLPHLREAMRGLNAYAVFEKTEHSGLFLVESTVYKLFDF
ncbi:MAG: hypothetical protein Q7J64_03440 [Elusimicrobiota bacterium]|nr:hypothetical protein [Elusimicrobiota bacterium]